MCRNGAGLKLSDGFSFLRGNFIFRYQQGIKKKVGGKSQNYYFRKNHFSGNSAYVQYMINVRNLISGFKFRRQHWCLLFVLVLGMSFGLYMLLSSRDVSEFSNLSDVINNPQLQEITKLLREVPLVDG